MKALVARVSDDTGFTEFVETSVPDVLAEVIQQVRDEWDGSPYEWDGSPFFILSIPEHDHLDAFILTADAGAARLGSMLDTVRAASDLPVAAALVNSMPLITTSGVVPGEGLLSIFCAHADGSQAVTFKRLHEDAEGRSAVSDAPDDVEPHIMGSVTTQFMSDLIKLCGEVRAGRSASDSDDWDTLLEDAVSRLGTPTTDPGAGEATVEMLVRDLVNQTLAGAEGSFAVLAVTASPGWFVQWLDAVDGVVVEVSDPSFNDLPPLSPDQLATVARLGYTKAEVNFQQVIQLEAFDVEPLVALVVTSLAEVFGSTERDELETTINIEAQ